MAVAGPAWASGGDYELHFTSDDDREELGDLSFYQGRLGIVRPTYCWARQLAAYRILSGLPISLEAARSLEIQCLDEHGLSYGGLVPPAEPQGILSWREARKLVPGASEARASWAWRWVDGWSVSAGCSADAYVTAVKTLQDRIAANGASSPWVREWLAGQDAVFSNCTDKGDMPREIPDAPGWLKTDRDYQIAAAHFYREEWDEAIPRFARIAEDSASPWRKYGLYLVARSEWRRAASPHFEATEAAARRVLDDPSVAEMHDPARGILAYVAARTRTADYLAEVEERMTAPTLDNTAGKDVEQYTVVLNRLGDGHRGGPFLRWTAAMTSRDPDTAIAGWRRDKNAAWLIAALHATGEKPQDVLDEAARVAPSSPAWPTVSWELYRLATEQGKSEEARAIADRILAAPRILLPVRNVFAMKRLGLARDLSEFARDARIPMLKITAESEIFNDFSGTYFGDWRKELNAHHPHPEYFHPASAMAMNYGLPLKDLLWLATEGGMPDHLRRDLLLSVFARAALVEDWSVAEASSRKLAAYFPKFDGDFLAFRTANTDADRRYSAAILILRFPGAAPRIRPGLGYSHPRDSIGLFGVRWWGDLHLDRGEPWEVPRFLSEAERTAADRESAVIRQIPDACSYLGDTIVGRANAKPDDPRLPEALHLVVRCTQYTYGNKRPISKQAYLLLHKMFPDSKWARKTRFYF